MGVETAWKRQVKNRFSEQATEWAGCYADLEPTLSSQQLISRQRFALEMVEAGMPRSSRILEAGCGAGVLAAKLIQRGYAVWGIDLAKPMIRYARQLSESAPFGVGDIEHIPFPDNTFDVVVSLGVIEYLESDERALREVWRVLRPGGRAVIAIPNGRSPLRRVDGVVRKVVAPLRSAYRLVKYRLRAGPAPASGTFAGAVRHAPYRRFYRSRWLRLLRGLNFEPEEWICHGWGWLSSPLDVLVRSLSMKQSVLRRGVERLVGPTLLPRARETFVRSQALNWLGAEHVFRVRAIK